jgi:hypothetical protein
MVSDAEFSGRCLCGRVQFEIRGEIGEFAYCHCTSCRRASGTAFAANAPVRAAHLRWLSGRDEIAEFESSQGKFRAFCRGCGSPIYARHTSAPEWFSIRLGLIDDALASRATAHFNVSEKANWFDVTDNLPQYADDTTTSRVE